MVLWNNLLLIICKVLVVWHLVVVGVLPKIASPGLAIVIVVSK
jgi:hypothetical protein